MKAPVSDSRYILLSPTLPYINWGRHNRREKANSRKVLLGAAATLIQMDPPSIQRHEQSVGGWEEGSPHRSEGSYTELQPPARLKRRATVYGWSFDVVVCFPTADCATW